ncbi:hypothetical protein WDU94_010383 [Cyamophila willieti]
MLRYFQLSRDLGTMKNLHLFDSTNLIIPVDSISTQYENNTLKPIPLENGKLFFYDLNHLYFYTNNTLVVSYQTDFKINQVFTDELLNVFYIVSDGHIRSITYENPEQCYDTDIWAPGENLDIEADDEIVMAALSPDKEHIVLLMNSSMVVTLLSNFKLLSWQDLLSVSDKAAKESVNVGWGKAETQFQGSAKGSTSVVPAADIVDSGPPSLAWAQDSTLFAINYYNPNLNTRLVKVFKLSIGQCTLEYTSKPIPGLERHLSWRPHVMSHLASTQRLPNKFVLTFIEKNTEIKDSFELKGVEGVKLLKWNMDGTILSVVTDKTDVLLYTNSNWRWYLKQTLKFTSPLSLQWTSPYQCSILHSGSQLTSYTWSWGVDSEQGVVSVIDGAEVLVTDFNSGVIPPPMCTEKIVYPELGDTINRVIRLSSNQQHPVSNMSGNLVLVSASGNVYKENSGQDTSPSDTRAWDKLTEKWDTVGNLSSGKLLAWDESTFVFVNNVAENVLAFDWNTGKEEIIYTSPLHIVSAHRKSSSELIVQLSSRQVIVISRNNTNSHEVTPDSNEEAAFTLPELCSRLDYSSGHILSLGPAHTMYDNGIPVLSDVSSFVVHGDWLLTTTLTHRLVLYRLESGTQVDESQGISRFLERGGTLVTVTSSCSVILQMPRGNLETVTPRPLILDLLSDLLESKQYGRAFEQMRKHRIDLNLIVDYAPPSYPLLVSQVQDPHWLNTLVADLKPDDVTTLDACYAEYYTKVILIG